MIKENTKQLQNISSSSTVPTQSVIDLDDLAEQIVDVDDLLLDNEVEGDFPDVLQDYQDPGTALDIQETEANKPPSSPPLVRIPTPPLFRIPSPHSVHVSKQPMIQIPSSSIVGFNSKNLQLGAKVKIITNQSTNKIQLVPSTVSTSIRSEPVSSTIINAAGVSRPKPPSSLPVISDLRSLNNSKQASVSSTKTRPVLRFDAKTGEPIIGSIVTTKPNPMTKPVKKATDQQSSSTPQPSRRTVHLLPAIKKSKTGFQAKCNIVYVTNNQPGTVSSQPAQTVRIVNPASTKPALRTYSRPVIRSRNNQNTTIGFATSEKLVLSEKGRTPPVDQQNTFKQFAIKTSTGVKYIRFQSSSRSAPRIQGANTSTITVEKQVNPSLVEPVAYRVEGFNSSTTKVKTEVSPCPVEPVDPLEQLNLPRNECNDTAELERILTSPSPPNTPTKTPTPTDSQLVEIIPTKEAVPVDQPDNNQPIINESEKIPEIIQTSKKRHRSAVPVQIQIKIQKLSQEEIKFYTEGSNSKSEDKLSSNKSEVMMKNHSPKRDDEDIVAIKVESVVCKICRAAFSTQSKFDLHLRSHQSGSKQF